MRKILLGCLLLPAIKGFNQALPGNDISVNQQRIEKRIFELSEFGKDSTGRTNRVAFSKGDIAGRGWLINLMKKAGLEVHIDYAGNIIGKREGKNPGEKPIAFGSHIDMVPYGGNYDGCLGSVAALEVIETMNENKLRTSHPLEMIVFIDEEGGVIGSSAMVGKVRPAALKETTKSGLTLESGIKALGGNAERLQEVKRNKGDLTAFVELHIEQGGILEKANTQIGVTVEGIANHAGTTPMNARTDALLTASKLIIAAHEVINSYEGRQVGNVGQITAEPGAPNVIPGKAVFSLELRDLSADKIFSMFHAIEAKAAAIEKNTGTHISFRSLNRSAVPAIMSTSVKDKIVASAKKLGLSYQTIQSGAGHDAQEMSEITPAGMIFIPSVAGISHSPKEFSKPVDMKNGANVLLHTILAIDKE
jgi:N-carbamoyl-L-amino-acid hydrolase